MATLEVQASGDNQIVCYAYGAVFEEDTTTKQLHDVPGLTRAELVAEYRLPPNRCLVLSPALPVEEENADDLTRLVAAVAERLGFDSVRYMRRITRDVVGPAHEDSRDWLVWIN